MRFARAKTDIKLERVGVVIVKDLATKPRRAPDASPLVGAPEVLVGFAMAHCELQTPPKDHRVRTRFSGPRRRWR